MNIIDDHKLLSPQQKNCLEKNSTLPFKFGGFTSIDDILTKLNVNVIIEPGVKTRNQLPSWENMKQSFDKINNHWKNEIDRLDGRRRDDISEELRDLQNIFENHRNEMVELANLPLRGLYNPKDNNITLFPDEMKQEYGGLQMEELLVSTLAHETMHAYFNRPRHKSYPYVYFVEEPLAEFGMLLYLYETQSNFYQWAYNDVGNKKTCYRYGSTLMDQCIKEGSTSPTRKFLEAYKIRIDEYSVLCPINGEIKLPSISKTKSNGKASIVNINGQMVKLRWRNINDLYNLSTYFFDEETETLGLNGNWTNVYFDNNNYYRLFSALLRMHHVRNLYLGDCFITDDNFLFRCLLGFSFECVIVNSSNPFVRKTYKFDSYINRRYRFDPYFCYTFDDMSKMFDNIHFLKIFENSRFYLENTESNGKSTFVYIRGRRKKIQPKWKNFINFPTYSWDEKTETLGLNGDWVDSFIGRDSYYRLFKHMLEEHFVMNLYLGDCFKTYGTGFTYLFYRVSTIIIDSLNPFCKMDNDGIAKYIDGSLLPIYNSCGSGLYKIQQNGKWGIVNRAGKFIVPCQYDYIGEFKKNGLCQVKIGKHYGYINEQGNIQIPVEYDHIYSFENGVTVANKDGYYGIIDEHNNIIHPFDLNYPDMREIENGYATMKDSNGKWGAIDAKGNVVIPCQYDSLVYFDNEGKAKVKKDGKESLLTQSEIALRKKHLYLAKNSK